MFTGVHSSEGKSKLWEREVAAQKSVLYVRVFQNVQLGQQRSHSIQPPSQNLLHKVNTSYWSTQKFETTFEEILEKMTASAAKMDEAEKEFKDKDDDVNAAARRCVLMEGEATVSVEKLATTVMKLALMSKEADNIIKVAWLKMSNILSIHI